MGSEKKPLNPILGETFYGSWPDTNGRGKTDLTVEQVSREFYKSIQRILTLPPKTILQLLLSTLTMKKQVSH